MPYTLSVRALCDLINNFRSMRFSRILLPFILTALYASCSKKDDYLKFDNAQIRSEQVAENNRLIVNQEESEAIFAAVGPRVKRLVHVDGMDRKSEGRVTILSEDGYALTAYHLVNDGEIAISELAAIGKVDEIPKNFSLDDLGKYFEDKISPARVVWFDPELDLALIKFAGKRLEYFSRIDSEPEVGELVYSADDEGWGYVGERDNRSIDLSGMNGNGRFSVIGSIVNSIIVSGNNRASKIRTTMVVRGGMSGAPLVNSSGDLLGVITNAHSQSSSPDGARSSGVIIESESIDKIIAVDRRRENR